MSSTTDDRIVVVKDRKCLADGVVELTLADPLGVQLPSWEAGAHIDLVLGPDLIRQYSLCGDETQSDCYRIAVLRDPASRGGSRYVHDAVTVGQKVSIRGPRNNFPLMTAPRYLFIAGGIGITPIMPMIAQVAARDIPWRLAYGGRTRRSMAFRDELAGLHPDNVEIWPEDEYGLLDLDTLLDKPDDATAIYCCGPEPLLAAVETRCAAWPAGALHVERFTPKESPNSRPDTEFDVHLASTGVTVHVPTNRTVVEALEDAGVALSTSCREGTCGTCETTVLEGKPDHRDSLLTEEERAANDVMFPCVSRSRSKRLVIDL